MRTGRQNEEGPLHITASVPEDYQSHQRSALGVTGPKCRDGALSRWNSSIPNFSIVESDLKYGVSQ